jgi:hypothetical protein
MKLENVAEKAMIAIIFSGTLVSLLITVQHLSGNLHRSYDPWLLPVFIAMTLQILSVKQRS